jgi:hypothetical protein
MPPCSGGCKNDCHHGVAQNPQDGPSLLGADAPSYTMPPRSGGCKKDCSHGVAQNPQDGPSLLGADAPSYTMPRRSGGCKNDCHHGVAQNPQDGPSGIISTIQQPSPRLRLCRLVSLHGYVVIGRAFGVRACRSGYGDQSASMVNCRSFKGIRK